jgi:hypothetical protein
MMTSLRCDEEYGLSCDDTHEETRVGEESHEATDMVDVDKLALLTEPTESESTEPIETLLAESTETPLAESTAPKEISTSFNLVDPSVSMIDSNLSTSAINGQAAHTNDDQDVKDDEGMHLMNWNRRCTRCTEESTR